MENSKAARESYSSRVKAKFSKLSEKRNLKNKIFALFKDILQDKIDVCVAKVKDEGETKKATSYLGSTLHALNINRLKPQLPISINPTLPYLDFLIGQLGSKEDCKLSVMYNSGATLYAGYSGVYL